ncbi:hypothetical protein [Roseovarius albus]|nr:hypothetical protein [Roseovarius albus]
MTLDKAIEDCDEWERQSKLVLARLWRAIHCLDELERNEFVSDALEHVSIEDSYELECGLDSYLLSSADHLPHRYWHSEDFECDDLNEIEESILDDLLTERKHAFLRIWKNFDEKTKTSFLKHVSASGNTLAGKA